MLNTCSDFQQMRVVEPGTTTIKFHLLSVSHKVQSLPYMQITSICNLVSVTKTICKNFHNIQYTSLLKAVMQV